jgi:hypothetical protein
MPAGTRPTIHRAGQRQAFAIRRVSAQHADHPAPRSWVAPWDERAQCFAPFVAAHIILSAQYPYPDSMFN